MKNLNKKTTINIAFDKTNGLYIAYNTLTGIFVTGICVESACKAYRKSYFKSKNKVVVHDTSGSMSSDDLDRQYEDRKSMGR